MISYIYYGIDIYYNGNGRIFLQSGSTLKEIFLPKVITVTWPTIPLEGKLTWYFVTSHDNLGLDLIILLSKSFLSSLLTQQILLALCGNT